MVKLLPGNRNTCFHAENNEVEINPWKIKFLTHLYCQKRFMRVIQQLPRLIQLPNYLITSMVTKHRENNRREESKYLRWENRQQAYALLPHKS